MCTRYITPEVAAVERHWHIGRAHTWRWPRPDMFPKYPGPFIRAPREPAEAGFELAVGQWWLIADNATEQFPAARTYNARWEGLSSRWSFRGAWARGQRCLIPAESFFEPNWESGKHVSWRFQRADGAPWGLAGLWNAWIDRATGEVHESYTMLTVNADQHPLMNRMHKPDPKRAAHLQDKRSVVPIEAENTERWLRGTPEEAAALVRLPEAKLFVAGPASD